jgi:hypothetical protein
VCAARDIVLQTGGKASVAAVELGREADHDDVDIERRQAEHPGESGQPQQHVVLRGCD